MTAGAVKIVVWCALVCALAGVTSAAEMDAVRYNAANALYRAGNYEAAIARYEALLAQGQNGAVYYNLGNAYFKAGQIGRAVLSYERALRLMPGDEDVRTNLRFVNALEKDREPGGTVNVVTRFLGGIYGALSAAGLAVFCSVCLFIAAGAGIGWLFAGGRRPLWIGLLVLAGLGVLSAGPTLALKVHDLEGVQTAVVLAEEVVGRSGPGEDYLQVFTLHEGTRVRVERVEGIWLLVQLSSGLGGWLPAEAVERI